MPHTLKFSAGWIIDGTGESINNNSLIEVKNGIISSIKENHNKNPKQPHCIDLSQCTVLPAFIDSHVHLFMSGTDNMIVRKQQLDSSFEEIKNTIKKHLIQQLLCGVLAVRDGGDYASHTLRYKKECLASEDLPIYIKAAGRAWRASGHYGKLIGRPPLKGETLAQGIATSKEHGDHIKIVNSGLNSLTDFAKETLPQFSAEELTAAFRIADALGLQIMVHANGELPVRLAIEAGCHSIEHGFFMGKDNVKRMADAQVTWVPTAFTMKAYFESLDSGSREKEISWKNLDHQLEQISYALKHGVQIAVGTDCGSLGVHHGSALRQEIKLLMQAGFSLEKAIQCATHNGAKLLGLEKNLGNLTTGMPATFIAVNGDPSSLPDSLDKPDRVFIDGKECQISS